MPKYCADTNFLHKRYINDSKLHNNLLVVERGVSLRERVILNADSADFYDLFAMLTGILCDLAAWRENTCSLGLVFYLAKVQSRKALPTSLVRGKLRAERTNISVQSYERSEKIITIRGISVQSL